RNFEKKDEKEGWANKRTEREPLPTGGMILWKFKIPRRHGEHEGHRTLYMHAHYSPKPGP
ncbi:hypothetical protein OFC04_26270, partial [Escherichia coli]|nr:hypothetical protein [Escherichia coli]